MPIHFANLAYDYYLLYVTLHMTIVLSILGLVISVIGTTQPTTIGSVICTALSILLGSWCILITRFAVATYTPDTWYVSYCSYFMVGVTVASAILIGLMQKYIQFAYTTNLFRTLMVLLVGLSGITYQYYQNSQGMLLYNLLSMAIVSCSILILTSVISTRFIYYLRKE